MIQGLLRERSGLVLDVKMKLDRTTKPAGIELWRP
jgi:UDP-N-acetyl-D-galactosamine dehydrogenase